jgi:O-acetyl-ADP-ribose deacetylase (regulator of RNase III)
MRWTLKQTNILDESADALICSANVNLMLSGGVGAELLARYGGAMQQDLQRWLQSRSPRCAARGDIIPYMGREVPYKVVLHAVAIDGWYESSPEIITDVTRKALEMAASHGARKVALTALATGFGHLTFAEFAQGVRPLLRIAVRPIEEIVICLLLEFEVAELACHLPEIECIPPLPNPH